MESHNEEKPCPIKDVDNPVAVRVAGFVSSKLVVFLFGIVSMWTGCYFTYLGSLPRIAFGRSEAEDFAISLAGSFTVSFVFFVLVLIALSKTFDIKALIARPELFLTVRFLLIPLVFFCVFLAIIGVDANFFSSTRLLIVSPLLGVLVAASHAYMVIFFLWAQVYFHTRYLVGFFEALKGVGGCLGLLLLHPTNTFGVETLWAAFAAPVFLFLVWMHVGSTIKAVKDSDAIEMEDTYWYTTLTRVIMSRSFWYLTCYCVFCSGPFLSVSYWWCSVYL